MCGCSHVPFSPESVRAEVLGLCYLLEPAMTSRSDPDGGPPITSVYTRLTVYSQICFHVGASASLMCGVLIAL